MRPRQKRTVFAKGYSEAGASYKKRALRGFIPNSGAPNEDINDNNSTLRQRSRMLYMSSPIATSAINTNRTKIIGMGLKLKSIVNSEVLGISNEEAKVWQKKTEAEFKLWSSKKQNCDALGINNFASLQQLALISWLLSGDCFALVKREDATKENPYTLRLHLIEADRISTPTKGGVKLMSVISNTTGETKDNNKIYDGVEVDKNGKIVAYHICNNYPNQLTATQSKWTRVLAYGKESNMPNIFHIMSTERPDQYRGVPFLAPVIETILQLRRYTESELMAALIQSFFTAWIETTSDTSENPLNEVGTGDIAGVPTSNPQTQDGGISKSPNEYELGPGTVNVLDVGEKVQFGNPNIPTAGFDAFVSTLCRLVGAALELPHDVLVKEFNKSYSASRAALSEAWEAFKMRRSWFIDDFCQPVYELWLSEAVAIGRIKAPGFFTDPAIKAAWCGTRWIGPVQAQLDPTKEVAAAAMQVKEGFKTREQVTLEMGGGDYETNAIQLERENKMLPSVPNNLTGGFAEYEDDEE